MKERLSPCTCYVCSGADCKRGIKAVTMSKCQHCDKYMPRKTGNVKVESIRQKREKSKLRDVKKYMKERE